MEIRECKEQERESAIELINKVFRTSVALEGTMHKEFPLLLGKDNLDHMIVAVDHGKVVSAVNYYASTILVESTPVKAVSIGAVCTDESYRGKNLATKLLDFAEEKMIKEGVHFEIISGTRNLYLSRGAAQIGPSYAFKITENLVEDGIDYIEYKDEYLKEILKIYNDESTRFYRSKREFQLLRQGATYPWGNYDFKFLCLKQKENIMGYIVITIDKCSKIGYIKEVCGNRELLANSLGNLYKILNLNNLYLECSWNDSIVKLLKSKNISYDKKLQSCTVKILNAETLFKALEAYLIQYLDAEILKDLKLYKEGESFKFNYKEESITLNSVQELNSLVFGALKDEFACNEEAINLKAILKEVFPIPFLWTGNMNFQ